MSAPTSSATAIDFLAYRATRTIVPALRPAPAAIEQAARPLPPPIATGTVVDVWSDCGWHLGRIVCWRHCPVTGAAQHALIQSVGSRAWSREYVRAAFIRVSR